jgi:hypothetical protein
MLIDKITGEVIETTVIPLSEKEATKLRRADWYFDWKSISKRGGAYKLVAKHDEKILFGLMSMRADTDYIFLENIERLGAKAQKKSIYNGVVQTLTAFACNESFSFGFKGYVVFESKSKLTEYYERILGSQFITSQRMYIDTLQAIKLIEAWL